MALLAIGGVLVAGLVVWALTRTVQPAPSASTEIPVALETTPGTTSPLDTASTAAPHPEEETNAVPRIEVADLKTRLSAVTVIDVRAKDSYIGGHIPGSLNLPVSQVESRLAFLPKDKPIVTYCT